MEKLSLRIFGQILARKSSIHDTEYRSKDPAIKLPFRVSVIIPRERINSAPFCRRFRKSQPYELFFLFLSFKKYVNTRVSTVRSSLTNITDRIKSFEFNVGRKLTQNDYLYIFFNFPKLVTNEPVLPSCRKILADDSSNRNKFLRVYRMFSIHSSSSSSVFLAI